EEGDGVLIVGDRNSCLGGVCGKGLKIGVLEMEGGNRWFDENVGEEMNGKIVEDVSDVNVRYREDRRGYLLDEGLNKGNMFVRG
ncbi:UDP-N-acetylglucosamine 2-epimerase, partial [Staphylococcus aureus]|uniref:UDP-N-acetylglucosamine 2-epimerase n=1 Tax=Staphylococcus aureus TaxID=1280 RepID=UPI0016429D11